MTSLPADFLARAGAFADFPEILPDRVNPAAASGSARFGAFPGLRSRAGGSGESADLEKKGLSIGPPDLLIAGTASGASGRQTGNRSSRVL